MGKHCKALSVVTIAVALLSALAFAYPETHTPEQDNTIFQFEEYYEDILDDISTENQLNDQEKQPSPDLTNAILVHQLSGYKKYPLSIPGTAYTSILYCALLK